MIEIKNIKKTFNGKEVLAGISGRFEDSNTSLIIGGSGTGKSVLLKCIVGLIKPDSGGVYYDGRDFINGDRTIRTQIRREIGMLFQGSALFDSKTVEENVMFPLDMLTDMPKNEKLDRVNFCLKRVGLENVNKRMPSEISGGMMKRVGIARAIVMNPKYLFVDEPNSGLDPLTAVTIDELIAEITDEYKITTIVVTHDMNSVMGIGEYVMFLYKGRKLWEGDSQNIVETNVPELKEFLFANKFIKHMKENEANG
ncbi:ATP-binding cassette domain-containing protein [Rhodocytophaga aerolata]|uniref:ATP-binding cassette domain-containing protein n=1 Tax=Rhodocytophaga aerolata TaxID=455078 RepID=A0ABT8R5A8_9BACT|nr:ATP-binding cassette domain-containing protein [Rhodocytophaga aerolata]MDO1445947.1 ATP-binding cassette domain-containing protein [Rhodocytophaga aerolata]